MRIRQLGFALAVLALFGWCASSGGRGSCRAMGAGSAGASPSRIGTPPLIALAATAQDEKPPKEPPRYGFSYNGDLYSQKSPKDAIQAVVKAIDARRVDYLLAQIAEPKFVDGQVAQYRQQFTRGKEETRTFLAFDRLVSDTVDYFLSDPILIKDLRLFARDGKWDVEDDVATGTLKDVPARKVFFKRIGERWFLENRQN